ncbi:MAG: flippase-like domain-containing protein [Bacteroidales bacterium]|nr:flippase-like domain-containing protein [Bacteroidales bacterium]
MEKKTRDILGYAFSAVLAVVLLGFSFRGIAWSDFWQGVKSCRWEWIVAAMLLGLCSYWLRGVRWRELLLPIDASTQRITCFNAVNISYVANMVLPRLGEIIRCGYITRHAAREEDGRSKASFDKVFGTVVVDRVWDTLTMGLLALGLLALMGNRIGQVLGGETVQREIQVPWLLGGVVLAGLAALAAVWYGRDRNRFCGKVWDFVRGIFQGMASCLKMKGWWKFLLYTALIWGCYWLTSACVLESVQGRLPGFEALTLSDAFVLMIVGSLSSVIPVPGGFGAYHYLVSMTLSTLYGIPTEYGLIWATLSHESQALAQLLAGGGSFLHETLRK